MYGHERAYNQRNKEKKGVDDDVSLYFIFYDCVPLTVQEILEYLLHSS